MSSLDRSVPHVHASDGPAYPLAQHPFHAFLLAGAVTLFIAGLLSDTAYFATAEIQWKNFTSWLAAGALVFNGFSILWAIVDLVRAHQKSRHLVYLFLLVVVFAVGLVNELLHAEDAWATMPRGLILSVVCAAFATAANIYGFSNLSAGRRR